MPTPTPPLRRPLAWAVLAAGLVLAASLIAYYPSIAFNQLLYWDTEKFILTNPHVQSLSPANLSWMLTEIYDDHWHPYTWLSHAVDYALFEREPWGYHLHSVLVHGLNALGLLALALALLSLARRRGVGRPDAYTLLAGFAAALLFAVHPQHIQSVAWEAERKDVLSLFFCLGALLAYLGYAQAVRPAARRYWYGLSLACFGLAVLSKSMSVTLPAVLLLLDAYPLRRLGLPGLPALAAARVWPLVKEKLPFFALSLFSIGLTLAGQVHIGAVAELDSLGLGTRLLNAQHSLIFYLSKFLLPVGLSAFYPFPDYSQWLHALPPLLGVVGITLLCLYGWSRNQPYWLAAWLFYLLTLAPVVGIVQSGPQAAADRYAYFPTLVFYLLAGAALARLYQWRRWLGLGLLAAWAGALLLFTEHQVRTVWRDELSLWRHAALYYPQACEVQTGIAAEYMRRKQYDDSARHLLLCLREEPLNLRTHNQLASVYLMAGRPAEALRSYEYIVAHSDADAVGLATVYFNLAVLHYNAGRHPLARANAERALELQPGYPQALDLTRRLQ